MPHIALTRNRISVYRAHETTGELIFQWDWPREKAQGMAAQGVVEIITARAVRLIPGARAEADTRTKLRHPHAPTPKRADSTTGDAGRGWARGNRTLHIGLGHIEAGLHGSGR